MLYAFMIIFAIGMFWANWQYKAKGATWGRPLAGLFGVLALLFTAVGCGGAFLLAN